MLRVCLSFSVRMIVNERGESENCYELSKQTKQANNRNRKRIGPTKNVLSAPPREPEPVRVEFGHKHLLKNPPQHTSVRELVLRPTAARSEATAEAAEQQSSRAADWRKKP
ncbi:uncharacterized protein LOC121467618 [Drosophila elegans]|uniref:uncharacterized protein LOC121467618 n=1 Tax=Drosophila elegans TaxID=30023 RepID=UPI001BC85B6A|nr:uncharacterized protein LOC121467618 [Drosophila elegans]